MMSQGRRRLFRNAPFLAGLACLALAACGTDNGITGISETIGDIRVTLAPVDRTGEVFINLEIRNTGTAARNVQFGADCNPTVRVHEQSSPDEEVVWEERNWREDNGGCLPAIRNADLFSGGAVGVTYRIPHTEILGDSLPPGNYRIVVVFTMNQPIASFTLNPGTVMLAR